MDNSTLWLIFGFIGQGLFFMRWIVQWLATEKNKESQIPFMFWIFSLVGGAITLVYAIYRKDPVFILAQGFGLMVYLRNIYFIYFKKKK